MCRVSGPLDEAEVAVRHRGRDGARFAGEFGVERTGQDEDGHREFAESRREPRLGSRAGKSQRSGQSGAVSTSRAGLDVTQRGEEGLGEPLLEERVGADLFDAPGQSLVGLAALFALKRIFDAARRAEQDEASDAIWVFEGHVQRHARTEGVAAKVDRLLAQGCRDQIGGLSERCANRVGVAVARQVERPDLARTCQNGSVLVGRGSGLGEAVEPREGCARALALDGEE